MKSLRTPASIGLTLVAAFLLAGCSPAIEENPLIGGGNASTDWRDDTNQSSISPDKGLYVDQTDTSRQDGSKSVKFITEDVESINPVSGRKVKTDETTLLEVTSTKVVAIGSTPSFEVYGLALNAKGKLAPALSTVETVNQYSIVVTFKYISGYKDFASTSAVPLLWPVTDSGATTYVTKGTGKMTLGPTDSTFSLTAVTKAGVLAPTGVRYMQFDDKAENVIAPIIDIFPQEVAPVTPKTTEVTE